MNKTQKIQINYRVKKSEPQNIIPLKCQPNQKLYHIWNLIVGSFKKQDEGKGFSMSFHEPFSDQIKNLNSQVSTHLGVDGMLYLTLNPNENKPDKQAATLLDESILWNTLGKYMFQDDDDKVKIIVTVPGLTKDNAKCKVVSQVRAVSLQIMDLDGKNWQFSVPKLFNRIIEDKSRIIVKDGKVTIIVQKVNAKKHWSDLQKVKYIGEKDGDSEKD